MSDSSLKDIGEEYVNACEWFVDAVMVRDEHGQREALETITSLKKLYPLEVERTIAALQPLRDGDYTKVRF